MLLEFENSPVHKKIQSFTTCVEVSRQWETGVPLFLTQLRACEYKKECSFVSNETSTLYY